MSTQLNWEIASVKCIPEVDGKKNVVRQIEWLVNATDGQLFGAVNGRQDISFSPDTFVPYESLTQPQMIQWVKSTMTVERIAEIEALAVELMNPVNHQPTGSGSVAVKLPWVK